MKMIKSILLCSCVFSLILITFSFIRFRLIYPNTSDIERAIQKTDGIKKIVYKGQPSETKHEIDVEIELDDDNRIYINAIRFYKTENNKKKLEFTSIFYINDYRLAKFEVTENNDFLFSYGKDFLSEFFLIDNHRDFEKFLMNFDKYYSIFNNLPKYTYEEFKNADKDLLAKEYKIESDGKKYFYCLILRE